MMRVKEEVRKLAKVEEDGDQLVTILIHGETGTGKELIAHALHSDRKGEFVALNCAGLPENLVESELFGYVKGAFTGADKDTPGLMETAKRGTLFLDEIGELSLQAQAKLLRVIQSKMLRRVGSRKHELISCRIVCATHRNLLEMTTRKEFREDLYARLSTFELYISPLDNRRSDIPLILKSIKGGEEYLKHTSIDKIDVRFNVRSLQQAVKRYNVLGKI